MISQNMGIRVVISNGTTVREAIETFIQGNTHDMDIDHTCGGGQHH
jgi:predicted Fe-Mo cluster-binding NifX family protein